MTAAAFLPQPARPPHDPLWMVLGGTARWTGGVAAKDVEIEAGGCALRLAPAPGSARLLSEESGSLGGIVPPANVAVDCEGFIWLLGKTSALLRRFDPCTCSFITVPCTAGRGPGKRTIVQPAGIAAADSSLFLCDSGPPGRLLVYDRRSFALRSILTPPPGATKQPWSPRSVVVDGPIIYVSDPANGAIHRFARWGGWLGMWEGFGAVSTLALDCSRRLHVVVPGAPRIIRLDRAGQAVDPVATPAEVAGDFPPPPFRVAADGTIDLCSICPDDAAFDRADEPKCAVATPNPDCAKDRAFDREGNPVCFPPTPNPAFALTGTWTSNPLDSRIAGCVWHRVECDAATAMHQRVGFATYTAEVPVPDVDVALLPDDVWVDVPAAGPGQDALILSPPGRYLWLRIKLEGDGRESPRLCSVTIEYPRISLRRYLPAAFGSDPVSADFADRLLAIFDCGFRQIEDRIDNEAMLFDADSAPADPGADVLAWLGAWLGLNLERSWPEQARRAALKAASRAFACRGTVRGLRETLLGWLGWSDFPIISRRPACGPRCRPAARQPDKPYLILEHWKLRRWLWLGKGKLGSDSVLWGEKLLGRSQLNATARLDATKLDTTGNPLTDPFAVAANRFSLFLPACYVTDPRRKGQVRRLVDEQSPAGVLSNIVAVHARMRIGIQASIGFDSVVGCWPSGITVNEARLGRGTVLSSTNPGGITARIGRTARLQPAPGRAAA
jgi:phage tail-like protein